MTILVFDATARNCRMRFPSRFGPAKVSAAVFANEPCQAWAKRSRPGSNSRRCRDEAAQSDVGISAYCRTGESCLRHLYLTRIMKDSLWSLDLVRCESVALRTFWVLVVMDQWTRRIVGFGIQPGIVDGPTLCRMFKQAIRGSDVPKYLSSDHDPLYRFHQWQANLRVLGVREIKPVPNVPFSHPFIERLVGTIRRRVWASRCSGPPRIWSSSYRLSKAITMDTALTSLEGADTDRSNSPTPEP